MIQSQQTLVKFGVSFLSINNKRKINTIYVVVPSRIMGDFRENEEREVEGQYSDYQSSTFRTDNEPFHQRHVEDVMSITHIN